MASISISFEGGKTKIDQNLVDIKIRRFALMWKKIIWKLPHKTVDLTKIATRMNGRQKYCRGLTK